MKPSPKKIALSTTIGLSTLLIAAFGCAYGPPPQIDELSVNQNSGIEASTSENDDVSSSSGSSEDVSTNSSSESAESASLLQTTNLKK